MQDLTTNNLMVAIDLGTQRIRGVVGRRDNDGRVEVIASDYVDSEGIKNGVIFNLEKAAFDIRRLLRCLENKIRIILNEERSEDEKMTYEITGVYVGLNGKSITTIDNIVPRNLGGVEVTQEIIDMLYDDNNKIKIENKEILSVVTQEYIVDNSEETNPIGCIGTRIEGRYKVIIGDPLLKSNLYKCFERINIKVQGIFLSSIATASAVLSEEEKELGCVMIDFGAGTTSVSVYYKKLLRHIGVIPFGGNIITSDITDLKISEAGAEKLKVGYGRAIKDTVEDFKIPMEKFGGKEEKFVTYDYLAGIIEARMDDILTFVCGQVEKTGLGNNIDGIVITGGGSQLENLADKLKLFIGLDVRIGVPNKNISQDTNSKYINVEYAQSVGLLNYAEKPCVVEKILVTDPVLIAENVAVAEKPQPKKGKSKFGIDYIKNAFGNLFSEPPPQND